MTQWIRALGVVLALGGCGAQATADAPPAFCTDEAPLAPTFANMTRLFEACTGCHTAAAPLDLKAPVAYANLVNRVAPSYTNPTIDESCGGMLVTPGDPARSYLYQKVSTPAPCAGGGMPLNEFGMTAPLPPCAQRLVRDWIAAGAPAE